MNIKKLWTPVQVHSSKWLDFHHGLQKADIMFSPNGAIINRKPMFAFTLTTLIPFIVIPIMGLSYWSIASLVFFIYGYGEVFLRLPLKERSMDTVKFYGYYFHKGNYSRINVLSFLWGEKRKDIKMPWYDGDCR